MFEPDWARAVVYRVDNLEEVLRALDEASIADLIIKASGTGAFDRPLECQVPAIENPNACPAFRDCDAPATLGRLTAHRDGPFREPTPVYDIVLTFGGGPRLVDVYEQFGAISCVPIGNGLDTATYHLLPPELANGFPDRGRCVQQFLLAVAVNLASRPLSLAGNSADRPMAAHGCSSGTWAFEAARAGKCITTDARDGITESSETSEIPIAGPAVTEYLTRRTPQQTCQIGEAAQTKHADAKRVDVTAAALAEEECRQLAEQARHHVLADHTALHRALALEGYVEELFGGSDAAGNAAERLP